MILWNGAITPVPSTAGPQQTGPASLAEDLLDCFERDGQMMRITGETKKPVSRIKRGCLIVDCFHLDRPKSDLAGYTDAAVKGIQEQVLSQPVDAPWQPS